MENLVSISDNNHLFKIPICIGGFKQMYYEKYWQVNQIVITGYERQSNLMSTLSICFMSFLILYHKPWLIKNFAQSFWGAESWILAKKFFLKITVFITYLKMLISISETSFLNQKVCKSSIFKLAIDDYYIWLS